LPFMIWLGACVYLIIRVEIILDISDACRYIIKTHILLLEIKG
jgi:hypothetical protein